MLHAIFRLAAQQHGAFSIAQARSEGLSSSWLTRQSRRGVIERLAGQDPIELDLDWPGALLDVELDGRDHIERARVARRDRQRDRLLQGAGFRVLRYTWDDYVADPDGMIAEIGRFLAATTPSIVS